jgi:hypothetical protein
MRTPPSFAFKILPAILLCLPPSAFSQISYSRPTARVVRNADGTRLNIKVDPHLQRVEEVLEDSNKTVVWRLVKELDDTFQPLKAVKYDSQNRVVSRHHYLVLRGRIEEEEIHDANDKFLSKLVFYYDSKARMTRIEQLNAQGTVVSVSRSSGPGSTNPPSPTPPSTPSPSSNAPAR